MESKKKATTETQRTQMLHREKPNQVIAEKDLELHPEFYIMGA